MRIKFVLTVVLTLVLSLAVIAEESDYIEPTDEILSVKEATLEITLSSRLNINPTKTNYVLANAEAKIFLFPTQSFHQEVLDFMTLPRNYDMDNGSIVFSWDNPEDDVLPFYISSTVKTDGRHVPVKRLVAFPISKSSIGADAKEYLLPQENIDSDDSAIVSLAAELSEGKTDLYDVVFTVADWVHTHIEYDLSTLTADVAQSASWTLENRYGVCDEMTSLFIALLRANGIPAKYVSGISYTNSDLFSEPWGPHGWAEVYFPGYDWIPFDVTYEEYGYIDASHIELRKTADSGTPSSYYGWYGANVNLVADKFDIQPYIVSMSHESYIDDPDVEIIATLHDSTVGFDSFNLIEVTVKNLRNYYLPYAFFLTKIEDIYTVDKNPQLVLLEPGETKKLFWKIHVSPSLDKNYIYTFPFRVYTKKNESASVFFKAKSGDKVYTSKEIDRVLESIETNHINKESQDLKFACDFETGYSYYDEEQTIICQVANSAEISYDLSLCIYEYLEQGVCQDVIIPALSTPEFRIHPNIMTPGKRDIQLTLKGDGISKLDEIEQVVLDYPKVDIIDVKYPEDVSYGDEYQFKFVISGKNIPKDLKVNIRLNSLSKTWRLDELTIDREFVISMNSKDLYPGENEVFIKVLYDDDNDQSYNVQESYNINLVDVPTLHKIILILKKWFESSFQ